MPFGDRVFSGNEDMWGIGHQPAPVKALLLAGGVAAFATHYASTGTSSHARSCGYEFQEVNVDLQDRACYFPIADFPLDGSAAAEPPAADVTALDQRDDLPSELSAGSSAIPLPAKAVPSPALRASIGDGRAGASNTVFKPDYEQESSP